jgi:hypothetical protein
MDQFYIIDMNGKVVEIRRRLEYENGQVRFRIEPNKGIVRYVTEPEFRAIPAGMKAMQFE